MTIIRTATAGLALLLAAACTAPAPPRSQASTAGGTVCAAPQSPPGEEKPTTIDVVEQAYFCILGNYYSGATLDARSLLIAGFIALTQELNRNGRDVPEATMPALKGDRKADWAAFEAVFRKIADQVPDLRVKLAVAALEAMVTSLDDNHASWAHDVKGRHPDYYEGDGYGLGLQADVDADRNLGVALPPLVFGTLMPHRRPATTRPDRPAPSLIYWSMADDMTRRLTGTATPTWRDPAPGGHFRASPVGRIERLMAGRTVVTVAHRMRTVQRADRIAFLDGGRVVEEAITRSWYAAAAATPISSTLVR